MGSQRYCDPALLVCNSIFCQSFDVDGDGLMSFFCHFVSCQSCDVDWDVVFVILCHFVCCQSYDADGDVIFVVFCHFVFCQSYDVVGDVIYFILSVVSLTKWMDMSFCLLSVLSVDGDAIFVILSFVSLTTWMEMSFLSFSVILSVLWRGWRSHFCHFVFCQSYDVDGHVILSFLSFCLLSVLQQRRRCHFVIFVILSYVSLTTWMEISFYVILSFVIHMTWMEMSFLSFCLLSVLRGWKYHFCHFVFSQSYNVDGNVICHLLSLCLL